MFTTRDVRWVLPLALLLFAAQLPASAGADEERERTEREHDDGRHDEKKQADEGACDDLSGGALGLCKAFCEAKDCDQEPQETRSCESLRRRFERRTGSSVFPCEVLPVGTNKSGPIAITADGRKLVAANTDTDTVSIFKVRKDGSLKKKHAVEVGDEPRSVATLLRRPLAYVANTVSGTVSVLDLDHHRVVDTIDVGTAPQAVVASPNGSTVYVANASDNTVEVIDTHTNRVIATIPVGRSPRALAITNDGDADDRDETLYVPNFFARPRTGFTPPSTSGLGGGAGAGAAFPPGANGSPVIGEGIFDDSREAVVDVISTATNTVVDQVVLAPIADTGFNFARGAFVSTSPTDGPRTIFADGGTDGALAQATGAFPNMLQSIALLGDRGFVPNTAASPEPPLRFNINAQSLVSVFAVDSNQELADQTFNMNRGINFDLPAGLLDAQIRDNTERMFPSVPVDIDCSDASARCWVVS